MAVELEVQKRKLEEAGTAGQDVGEAAAKRLAGVAEAGPMDVDVVAPLTQMKNEDFSMELLRIYYERLMPFRSMVRWLSYGNNSKSSNITVERDFFLRREFTFVLEGDIFCRYLSFRDEDEFRSAVMARQPIRMEIGAVFTHPPKNHNTVIKDAYKPLERELVFDIDMDDYDDIRTCCKGANLCDKCWTFMKAAVRTLTRALTDDFGFKHFMFVYSGRRGVHCWVCDPVARRLTNEQRSAVAEYLNLVTPGANRARAELKMNGCQELHPAIREAYAICEQYFRDDPKGVLQGQDILKKGSHLSNIVNQTFAPQEQDEINKFLAENPAASSYEIWLRMERIAQQREAAAATHRQKQDAKVLLKDVVIQYTYPRLDINVSKQMNHLLKSPFVIHPKTGRVCVPIDPSKLDSFDPKAVPTIGRLVEELNSTGDAGQTSLREYTRFFETQFLSPLEAECLQDKRLGDLSF